MDLDIFYQDCRPIENGFEICYGEFGEYYLVGPDNYSYLSGNINKIGWTNKYILVQTMRLEISNPGEWVAINTESKESSRWLTENEVVQFKEKYDIVLLKPEVAWQKLPMNSKGLIPLGILILIFSAFLFIVYKNEK